MSNHRWLPAVNGMNSCAKCGVRLRSPLRSPIPPCRISLPEARDEVVRAAVALNAAHSDIALAAPVDPTSAVVSRRLAWSDFRAAVAAYAKLAGGA